MACDWTPCRRSRTIRPRHILAEIAERVAEQAEELGRAVCVIAESDENDAKLALPAHAGGYGLDAVWSDDFHHAVHAFFTGERKGYYQDFWPAGADCPRVAAGLRLPGRAIPVLEWTPARHQPAPVSPRRRTSSACRTMTRSAIAPRARD